MVRWPWMVPYNLRLHFPDKICHPLQSSTRQPVPMFKICHSQRGHSAQNMRMTVVNVSVTADLLPAYTGFNLKDECKYYKNKIRVVIVNL